MTTASEPIEPDELPVMQVIIEALTLPVRHPLASLVCVGIAAVGTFILYGVAVIGAAHGISFRLKTGRTGTRGEDIVAQSDLTAETTAPVDQPEE